MSQIVTIDRLGQKGDGVAAGPVFVPYALPGETVEIDGMPPRLIRIIDSSADRIEAFCVYFGRCGGCATQHMSMDAYRAWKYSLVVDAIKGAGIETEIHRLVDAHGAGRRRATFHARKGTVGFSELRSHDLVAIDACPILVPTINAALPILREIEKAFRDRSKPLDGLVTATNTGLDLDIRGAGPVEGALRLRLVNLATRHDVARLSNHGDVLMERRQPLVHFGSVDVCPPPGGFLQATERADQSLARLVVEALVGARHVADLFSGCGTLSFPIARTAHVFAADSDAKAIAALSRAAHFASGLKPIRAEARDLFHRPLMPDELASFDAVVFDPPRAGAEAQAKRLAASKVKRVVGVSCDIATFIRDAKILIASGFLLRNVTPVDQFRHTPHVELVGVFQRKA